MTGARRRSRSSRLFWSARLEPGLGHPISGCSWTKERVSIVFPQRFRGATVCCATSCSVARACLLHRAMTRYLPTGDAVVVFGGVTPRARGRCRLSQLDLPRRALVLEEAFPRWRKKGLWRVRVATTTLARGSTTRPSPLNRRRTHIHPGPTPTHYKTVAEYKNMIGRSGRSRLPPPRERVCDRNPTDVRNRVCQHYVLGEPEDVVAAVLSRSTATLRNLF